MAQAVRCHDIHSQFSHGLEKITLHCPSQDTMSIIGQLGAKDLSIIWSSDSRYWKWITEKIGDHSVPAAELLNVCWLQIDGTYAAHKLTEGMNYEVKFVVKLKDNVNINCVDISLALPDGSKQEHKENLMQHPKNQIIGITAGTFQAQKSCGCGDIKFTMMATDAAWKHGLIVIGALIVPQI